MKSENKIRSVRLPDDQLAILLDALDRQDGRKAAELRRHKRMSFRTAKVVLHVLDNLDTVECSFRVAARNISANGMAFVHGQMLPPGKRALVEIPRKHNDPLHVLGQVAHCRHIGGMVHEVGLRFLAHNNSKHIRRALASLQSKR
ncbi:MAG: PilZ domain-containing protein [Planctomycetes bacterium]|nr:PilZ domain-containing protein [Planctomycetota bacterium]